ncbi:TlpA family protein disulfide reductase [[Acidovorax] ebreus]|uniref:TlpA family protein disulfide reductase n=1 Tax=Diaphorobacter sp. LI3 TaxID=2952886 RepID=UPI00204C43EB|nr:TlpA family protein disulfide reductase [Diaphorobacter sp. LI3]
MNEPTLSSSASADSAKAPSAHPLRRRRWLLVGAGALAALGGAGLAAWRLRPGPVQEGVSDAVWGAQFEGPAGEVLSMAAFRGRPLLLNFWATWCPPCVEELPLLNAFYGEHRAKGWQVVGLAIDQPSNVRKFLERMPLDFPIALGGLGGTDLARGLGNEKGGLPFTVLFGANGSILKRKMGQLTAQDLQGWSTTL